MDYIVNKIRLVHNLVRVLRALKKKNSIQWLDFQKYVAMSIFLIEFVAICYNQVCSKKNFNQLNALSVYYFPK